MKWISFAAITFGAAVSYGQTTKTPAAGGGGSGQVYYLRNGSSTPVSQDTGTPANSRPLPVSTFNTSGSAVDPATSQKQDTGNTSLSSIQTSNSSIDSKLTTTANGLKVDGSGVTQPVSASSLPLPAGAATSAKQDTMQTSLSSVDGKLTSTANGLKVDGSAVTQPVSAASLPLPMGAATEASLSSLVTKIPPLGQATKAASQPVVLASDSGTLPVVLSSTQLTAQSASALNADIIPAQDVSFAAAVNYQSITTGSGTFQFQGSKDGTTWFPVQGTPSTAGASVASANATGMWKIPVVGFSQFRIRMATYTSGTFTGNASTMANDSNDLGQRVVTIGGGSAAIGSVNVSVPSALTLTSTAVTGSTTAVRLVASGTAPTTRRFLMFVADTNNTGNCYYGSSAVTTASGIYMYPGAVTRFENDINDWYLICDAAAQTIRVVEAK